MESFDKDKIKSQITKDHVFDLLHDWGGDPEYTDFGFICGTICHNEPGVGSRKLLYYENTGLFRCYTGCGDYFDIFELCGRVQEVQFGRLYDLNESILYISDRFGFEGVTVSSTTNTFADWKIILNYEKLRDKKTSTNFLYRELKEYDSTILSRLNNVRVLDWEKEGISTQVSKSAKIQYCPGSEHLTIPHYDINNRLIGIRGRALGKYEAKRYGKYRPLAVGGELYNHPLGLNLYNLNNSYKNAGALKKVIVFEGEKSCLLYRSLFGEENDISVACCGSNLSAYQMELLLRIGAEEIVIAFDRQFQDIGDNEFQHLKKNLLKIGEKYGKYATISFVFDKEKKLPYKSSPVDCGKDVFLKLLNERIIT